MKAQIVFRENMRSNIFTGQVIILKYWSALTTAPIQLNTSTRSDTTLNFSLTPKLSFTTMEDSWYYGIQSSSLFHTQEISLV